MTVLTCLALGSAYASGTPDVDAVAKATARAREVTRAVYGSNSEPIVSRYVFEADPKAAIEHDRLVLRWEPATFRCDPQSGRLASLRLLPPDEPMGRALGLNAAQAEALRVFEIVTGRKDGGIVGGPTKDVSGRWGTYTFTVSPFVDGYASRDRTTITISADTGWPTDVTVGKELKPRRTGLPVVDRQEAANDLHRNLARLQAFPHERWGETALEWMVPDFRGCPNEMGPEHLAAAEAGESMLIYRVVVHDAESWLPEKNGSVRRVQAYVDAVSGRTIALRPLDLTDALKQTAGAAQAAPKWPGRAAQLRLAGGERPLAGAAIAPVELGKAPTAGDPVTLVSGNDAWNLRFDRKSGVVWMEVDGKRVYGKPNAPLLKALKQMKPSKLEPFGTATSAKSG